MSVCSIVLFLGIATSGLMAGFFFAWAVSVIPGTSRLSDDGYVTTMQNINREIINPVFVGTFVITPVILGLASLVHFRAGQSRRGWLLAAAAATYVIGTVGVTLGGNIPLNDQLEAFDLAGATEDAIAVRRTSYETLWNRWHNVRTVASIAAFGLAAAVALVETEEASR